MRGTSQETHNDCLWMMQSSKHRARHHHTTQLAFEGSRVKKRLDDAGTEHIRSVSYVKDPYSLYATVEPNNEASLQALASPYLYFARHVEHNWLLRSGCVSNYKSSAGRCVLLSLLQIVLCTGLSSTSSNSTRVRSWGERKLAWAGKERVPTAAVRPVCNTLRIEVGLLLSLVYSWLSSECRKQETGYAH